MSSSLGDEMTDKEIKESNLPVSSSLSIPEGLTTINDKKTMRTKSKDLLLKKEGPDSPNSSENHIDPNPNDENDTSRISAYARLDFDNYTFFVQTLQVVLGRKSNEELLNGGQHSVDVHLSSKKAISRRHAKIFYNFGTQRFELSILGRNGAFVDDLFIEKGMTIPLVDGTKIQIGDISFQFILPSVEDSASKQLSTYNKPFDPSDVISLRTSLYSTSNSNSPSRPTKTDEKKKPARKNSRSIPRRLSEARRKSLATATEDEINTILTELGVKSLDDIEDIDEQDPEYVDAQIRAILGDDDHGESAIADDDEEIGTGPLSSFQEGEEDELDQLVKQHNLEQGVELDESALSRDDMVIDDELVNLAPLIDAHNQDKKNGMRSRPLMGKPATPRMGKPASIQPPSSRLYGRPAGAGGKNQGLDMRLMGSQVAGLPTHLVAQGDYSLKLAQANPMNQFNKQYMPTRPPVPELLVPIQTIPKHPAPLPEVIIDKITVTTEYPYPPVHIPKIIGRPDIIPRTPRRRKDALIPKKPVKNIYTMNEIPEHYRTKPNFSFPVMIINVLKFKNDPRGLTMNEIYEGIKEIYPYYKYCPEGWQSVVLHNVKLNKLFKSDQNFDVPQNEDEEVDERWSIDETFVQEKEKVRKKQQEIAAQRAKEAAIRAEELAQKQRLEMQQSISQNIVGRDFHSPYGLPLNSNSALLSQSQLIAQLHHKNNNNANNKPKTIAEIASEIRRDGTNGGKAPMYFKSQDGTTSSSSSPPNIKAQLAANRSQYSQSPPVTPGVSSAQAASMNQDTKKSLTYLQKELFTLYKSRKLSYNTATTTEIITKALATTIAQVNVIGSKAGVGNNALSFLVERAPQQVSKILDIALTKSIKEKQGILTSRSNSSVSTPIASQLSSPKPAAAEIKTPTPVSNIVKEANEKAQADKDDKEKSGNALGKPPVFSLKEHSPLTRPQSYKLVSKPSQFVSSKPPSRPGYRPEKEKEDAKRPHDEVSLPRKAARLE